MDSFNRKLTIVVTGSPGAGKTTVCDCYSSLHKVEYLKLDSVIAQLVQEFSWGPELSDQQIDYAVKALFVSAKICPAETLLIEVAYHDVINLLAMAEAVGVDVDVWIYLDVDVATACMRNSQRTIEAMVPEEYVIRSNGFFPEGYAGWRDFEIIDATKSFEDTVQKFVEVIEYARQKKSHRVPFG